MRRGFTLIELLVVVAIIVVLLALLTPAMDKAVRRAEQVVCATNQRAFNAAIAAYYFENKRKLLTTARHYRHTGPFPNVPYVYADTHYGDWSLEAIKPYVGGVGEDSVGGPWVCPSSRFTDVNPGMLTENANRMRQPRGPYLTFDGTWIHSDYAYFAGANAWKSTHASTRDGGRSLSDKSLTSGRILMTDTFYRHNAGWYWYNHGPFNYTGRPAADGNNKMYGDGSVSWTDSFDDARNAGIDIGDAETSGPYVIGTGDQQSARGETNYY